MNKFLPLDTFSVNSPWVVDFAPFTHKPTFYIRTDRGWWLIYETP